MDALDEGTEYNEFANGLKALTLSDAESASNVQVFVTSRDDTSHDQFMKTLATLDLPLREEMKQDIRIYLSEEVEKQIRLGKLAVEGNSASIIIEKLEEKADGM